VTLQGLANALNPLLKGWINYYGRFYISVLGPTLAGVNQALVRWLMRKFKRFRENKPKARGFLARLSTMSKDLFAHWKLGLNGGLF
jgi:RNA-directed DNA polymerase